MTDLHEPTGDQPLPPPAPGTEVTDAAAPQGTGGTVARLGLLVGLLVLLGVAGSWWAVLVVVALILMIFMHELGHYLAARRAGMKVTEFFLGFGPRLWSTHKAETEYGVKGIPAGAYVKIVGMSNVEEVDPADEDRTYRSKPYWSRLCVAMAGSMMHFAMALALLFATLVFFGVPNENRWVVSTLSPDSPATNAGLLKGDQVVAVNGQPVTTFDDMTTIVRSKPGESVTLQVKRADQLIDITTTLATSNPQGEPVGFLGIGRSYPYETENALAAIPKTFATFGDVAWKSVSGLVHLFSPGGIRDYVSNFTSQPGDGTTGTNGNANESRPLSPVGAVQVGASLARNGMADLFFFLAAVNIFVGIFNLVPLPPFDGGHVAVATYEAVRSRKGKRYYADVNKLLPVAYAVFAILLVFFVGNLYLDLTNPFKIGN